MSLEQNLEHVPQGQALPIYDLRQPLQQALLASYLVQVQELEDAVWSLYYGSMVFYATGAALDMLGAMVGQPREGRTDEVYRVWILARSLTTRSNGKPEELLAILRMVCDSTIAIALREVYPARIEIRITAAPGHLDNLTDELAEQVHELMLLAKSQGIAIDMITSAVSPLVLFTLGTSSDYAHSDASTGLADGPPDTHGGQLTTVM